MKILLIIGLFTSSLIIYVSAHGRLIEPPSRASMWRYGFDTPHDYNDHESYCGGFTRQWTRNSGKCGICGDAWDTKTPRAHETGGKYGNGIIVRKYRTGAIIPVHIQLTANHRGYFEFRTCPMANRHEEVTQECLDKYLLNMPNSTARYYPGVGNKIFETFYKLPDDLNCEQCVFQWRYIAGNNWGDCGNGTGAVGCGPQEEFRGCADIAINDNFPILPSSTKKPMKPNVLPPWRARPNNNDDDVFTDDEWSTTVIPEFFESTNSYWYLSFIIAATCLFIVIAALALLYVYYYHSGRAKQWLMARRHAARVNVQPPIAPPRHKRLSSSSLHL
ncbi:hypothetical protein PV327_006549 [Microctonus hyperodae]|uniref:Chitin-binding type-4 domain-containing protein n=1 Tax=Microctonus hyperodae TaxID=165561 RepID=A0AA39KIE1_MICHY|nr:hypothetical protein PV327_006549 [Microctonus hyperodae]